MSARTLMALLLCAVSLGGCTAKYQDLLRDRDAQLRELNGKLSDLRAENADLNRREATARQEAAAARAQPASAPAPKPAADNTLAKVQRDLPDLDVRYDGGRLSIGIDSTVTFSSGSIALRAGATRVLSRVARVLARDFDGRRIYVEGHTDSDPIRRTKSRFRSNRHLSAERAEVVADYLVKHGAIPARSVVVVGYGEYRPRARGSSRTAKARNRRVEIVVGDPL